MSALRYERVHATKDEAGQSLDERMMPFQREGVQFGLKQGGRVLIGESPLFICPIFLSLPPLLDSKWVCGLVLSKGHERAAHG